MVKSKGWEVGLSATAGHHGTLMAPLACDWAVRYTNAWERIEYCEAGNSEEVAPVIPTSFGLA